jgi:iron complex outermembrane receptor protein
MTWFMKTLALIALLLALALHAFAQSDSLRAAVSKVGQDSLRFHAEEIVVYGSASFQQQAKVLNATDDALSLSQSVQLMRRANFAQEPAIRGMNAGQIAVTIDGMKMYPACVDRMDPISAYIEIENLERLDIRAGARDFAFAPTIGGSVNFVTTKPNPERSFLKLESGFETVSTLRRVRGDVNFAPKFLEGWAMRGSFSIKRSDDFFAGNQTRIERSGYAKENLKFNLLKDFENQRLQFSYIGDFARNIGYPALIMDATRTDAHLLSLDYEVQSLAAWLPMLTLKLYTNQVVHFMDDRQRPIQAIRERIIMPDMYMPMYGDNRTYGVMSTATLLGKSDVLKLTLDAYFFNAFADMEMHSIFPDVAPMYLLNLGDISTWSAALNIDYVHFFGNQFSLRLNTRLDVLRRLLHDELAKRQFQGYVEEPRFELSYIVPNLALEGTWQLGAASKLALAVSHAARPPTHIENFGFYLYNPLDNAIYVGNPFLDPERSVQAELMFAHSDLGNTLTAKVFYVRFDNYIAGETFIEANPSNRQFSQAFRRYAHLGSAYIAGLEVSAEVLPTETLMLLGTLSYQVGYLIELRDFLPFMPPLSGNVRVRFSQRVWLAEVGVRFALAQNQVSQKILFEDTTPAWAVFDIRLGAKLWDRLSVRLGVENILDRLYHEHLSINNLPSRGRNLYINLGYEIF